MRDMSWLGDGDAGDTRASLNTNNGGFDWGTSRFSRAPRQHLILSLWEKYVGGSRAISSACLVVSAQPVGPLEYIGHVVAI